MDFKKLVSVIYILLLFPSFASDKVHVRAIESFSSAKPKDIFKVELVEDYSINDFPFIKGDIFRCKLNKIIPPKRAKRSARIYFDLLSYEDNKGIHNFEERYIAKYSKNKFSISEIKKVNKKDAIEKVGGFAGDHFIVPGFSYGVSFADGFSENKEHNRLKSGFKKMYKNSFLSYVELGKNIEIKAKDEFYLVIKKKSQK